MIQKQTSAYSENKLGYLLSTDPSLLQLDTIHAFLKRTFWASQRTKETVQKTLKTSLCFGIYSSTTQVAFARIITDYCTFAYLCDVFVDENHRGRGLSKWLMEKIMAHPDLMGLRRFLLATKDAHSLYSRYGFNSLGAEEAARFMEIRNDAV